MTLLSVAKVWGEGTGGSCGTHVTEEKRMRGSVGKLQDKSHYEDLGVDGRILNGSYGKSMGECGAGFIRLRIRTGVALCELGMTGILGSRLCVL